MNIYFFRIKFKIFDSSHGHHRKGFIDLVQVHLGGAPAGLGEQLVELRRLGFGALGALSGFKKAENPAVKSNIFDKGPAGDAENIRRNYLHEKRKATLEATKAIGDLTASWQEYVAGITNPAFDATESKIAEINKRLEEQKKQLDVSGKAAGWSDSRIGEEQKRAEIEAQEARDKVIADYEEKARLRKAKEDKEAYEKLRAETVALEIAAEEEELSAIDRLNNERFRKHAELLDKQAATDDDAEKQLYQRQIESVDRLYDKKVEAEQRAIGEREAAARKSADEEVKRATETAERIAQAQVNAFSQARASIMASWQNQQSSSFQEMISYLRIIADQTGRG